MAETYQRPLVQDDCKGPVGLAATVHLSFRQPNTRIHESVRASNNGGFRELVTEMPHIDNRHAYPTDGPGFFNRLDKTTRNSEVNE